MKSLEIAKNDLRLFFKDRGNLIGLLLVPVVMTILLGAFIPAGDAEERVIVDVVDEDQSQASSELTQSIRASNSSLLLCPIDNDSDDTCDLEGATTLDRELSLERVEDSDTLAVIIIPDGYEGALQAGETIEIPYYADPDLSAPVFIRQSLETALQQVNGALGAEKFGAFLVDTLGAEPDPGLVAEYRRNVHARAVELWQAIPVQVGLQLTNQEEVRQSSAPPGFSQSVPGMATMFVMGTVFTGMVALLHERHTGTLPRLAMMPVAGRSILIGKVAGRFTLGMVQFLVVFAVGLIVGMYFGNSPLAVVLLMVAYTLAVTAISFALGSRLESEGQAEVLAQLLVLTLAPLGGAWWPLEITPPALQTIGHISPVAWAMDGFHDLFSRNGDLSTVLPEILVLLGFALVFSLIGIRRLRYA
jgi:ABC-2 type transport system permease protein